MQPRRIVSSLLLATALMPSCAPDLRAEEEDAEEEVIQVQTVVIQEELWSGTGLGPKVSITSDDIQRRNPQDLSQIFDTTPSVTVSSGGPANQRIFVNGIDQTKLNVQIDGARQQNTVWHHNGDFGLSPFFLKTIDVEEGVAPADAGPGALAGAIQVTTKDPSDLLLPGKNLGATVIGGYETNSRTYRVSASAYGQSEGWELMGIFDRAQGTDYKDGDGERESGTEENLYSGLAKLGYETQTGNRFVATGEFYHDSADRKLRPNLNLLSQPLLNGNTAKRLTTTATYTTTQPTNLFDPVVQFYYNRNVLERPDDNNFQRPAGAFNSYNDEIGGKLENTFAFDFGTATTGIDFYHTHVTVDRFAFDDSVSETIYDVGGYVQGRVEPIEDLLISTGVRLDFQSYKSVDEQTFGNVGASPNISAAYQLFDGFWVNAGYSYVFGGLEQAETALFHAATYIYSDDLKPSTSHNITAGATYAWRGFQFGGNWFRTQINNPVAYNYDNFPVYAVRVNGEDLTSQGYNIFARFDYEEAFVSGSFNHTDVTFGDRVANPIDGSNVGTSVGDILALEAGYAIPDWGLAFGVSSEITFDYDDEGFIGAGFLPQEGYQLVNLYSTWTPVEVAPHFTLSFDVRNLLNQQYVPRGSVYALPERLVEPVYAPGRSFLIFGTLQF